MAVDTVPSRSIRIEGQVPVCVDLLNGFRVCVGTKTLDYPTSASRLIAYLALRDRPVPRSTASGELWPDSMPEKAQASLRTACWRARQAIEGILQAEHDSLAICQNVRVDVWVLQDLAKRLVQGRAPDGDLGTAGPVFMAGELLPDWHDDWVTLERERFRLLSLNTLERLSDWYRQNGDFIAAAESALAAIRLEPLRESAHRALIATHLDQGNAADAVTHFRSFRKALRDEIGVEPTNAMTSLFDTVELARAVAGPG